MYIEYPLVDGQCIGDPTQSTHYLEIWVPPLFSQKKTYPGTLFMYQRMWITSFQWSMRSQH